MKTLILLGLLFIFASLVLVVFNIISGLNLSFHQAVGSESHLVRGIALSLSAIIGNLLLLREARLWIETEYSDALENTNSAKADQKMEKLYQDRQIVLPYALGSIFLSLICLITGTISYSGQFPIVHGVLGFLLGATLVVTNIQWWRFLWKLSRPN